MPYYVELFLILLGILFVAAFAFECGKEHERNKVEEEDELIDLLGIEMYGKDPADEETPNLEAK